MQQRRETVAIATAVELDSILLDRVTVDPFFLSQCELYRLHLHAIIS